MKKLIILLLTVLLITCTGCSSKEPEYEHSQRHGVDVYLDGSIEIPTALGYPTLTEEEVKEINEIDAFEKINNYSDALKYMTRYTFFQNSAELVNKICFLIANNYEEVGKIIVSVGNEYHTNEYGMMYIKAEDKYYPLDYFAQNTGVNGWLSNFSSEELAFDNLDDVLSAIESCFPYKWDDEVKKIEATPTLVKEIAGKYRLLSTRAHTTVYDYSATQIPLGLGEPKLSDDEIYELLKTENKEEIAEKIKTFPDLIQYITSSEIYLYNDGGKRHDNIAYADYGNVCYDDAPCEFYTLSGLELLSAKKVQCTAASTLFKYLLDGDYPEIGYIKLPGHAMIYIKGYDDKYYLVNPASYFLFKGETRSIDYFYLNGYVTDEDYASFDSVDELMDQLERTYQSDAQAKEFIAFVYDGVFACKFNNNLSKIVMMPIDADIKWSSDNSDFTLGEFTHSTSQTNIIGLNSETDIPLN